jgi:bacterioferritin-associated ferredoxin
MIVCLCNALTEAQLSDAVARGAKRPKEVYEACACKAQCGNCTRTILCMIKEAVLPVAPRPVAASALS